MKVVILAAGAGAMYCGACARDAALAKSFSAQGHEALVIPLYTPMRLEEAELLPSHPVLFGGVNAYLRETVRGFDRWPKGFVRLLDHPNLLAWAGKFAVKTQASGLGPMTCSMLEGLAGKHREEIARVAGLVAEERPDLVIISNTLLSGIVPALKTACQAKVLCQVQGEDGFLAELPESWRGKALALMRANSAQAEGLVAPCRSHAAEMADLLACPLERFQVMPHPAPSRPLLPQPTGPFTLGYLSSIRRAKGLDLLLEAFRDLSEDSRLLVGGRVLEPDFFKENRECVRRFPERVTFLGEVAPQDKEGFFRQIDLFVLPSRLKESRGVAALEALAYGRCVLVPRSGIFAEWEEEGCPGVLCFEPGSVEGMLRVIEDLERERLAELGSQGREWIKRTESAAMLTLS